MPLVCERCKGLGEDEEKVPCPDCFGLGCFPPPRWMMRRIRELEREREREIKGKVQIEPEGCARSASDVANASSEPLFPGE